MKRLPLLIALLAAAGSIAILAGSFPCPVDHEDCETILAGACEGRGGVATGSGHMQYTGGGVTRCTAVCGDGMVVASNRYGCWDE